MNRRDFLKRAGLVLAGLFVATAAADSTGVIRIQPRNVSWSKMTYDDNFYSHTLFADGRHYIDGVLSGNIQVSIWRE